MSDEPWLVVIDMQGVFAESASPWATPDFAAIVPAVGALIARHSPRVAFTRFVVPDDPSGAWIDYYNQWPFARDAPEAWWQIVPDLDSRDRPTVSRPTFGKWGRELREATEGATSLLLAGVSTDCCVLSTALAAADDGVLVEVAGYACAGLTPADHRRALDAMALYGPFITIADSPVAS